ncbi:dTMP kinase [Buchnera aphidicola]|uniref:dTMP kinase n=1 Tax=Buchnera aphidicola TaxID=9 RepID=UPI00223736B0|nr:dTMP kinase [Buchnera aphidicola]MCW5197779.1 dTMP kinase [Buchnera aphidicola (Chaitophorus viminalis)]
MKKNKFIVIEGLEGSGKTTACKIIKNFLFLNNIKKVIIVRQPGSTSISEKIRKIIKNNNKKEKLNKFSELFLLYSARIQLMKNIIKPALKKGKWIISDRHNLSSIAYQGGGRGIDQSLIKILNNIINKISKPDLTIFLDVKLKIGLKRAFLRSNFDRIEQQSKNFFLKVKKYYLKFLSFEKNKIIINANNNKKIVQKNIISKFKNWINNN